MSLCDEYDIIKSALAGGKLSYEEQEDALDRIDQIEEELQMLDTPQNITKNLKE